MPAPLSLLLIEDDLSDREWVLRSLKSARIYCDTTIAANGEEAILCAGDSTRIPFDLALIDFGLPDIDTMDLLRALRETPALKDSLLIALSGVRDPGLIHSAMDLGIHAFMNKPFAPQALMDTLTDHDFWLTFKRPA